MKIAVIGSGYVGLVTGACLADSGNEVWCVDKNETKIKNLEKGILPIYEPGLDLLIARGIKEGRLYFTSDLAAVLKEADVCFLTVDTPSDEEGAADLTNVFAVADFVGEHLSRPVLLVTKSTVPVGTTLKIKNRIQTKLKNRAANPDWITVASNPEFLKEGSAVQDFCYPDRIVVGLENKEEAERLRELYEPFMRNRDCFLVMDIASTELSKYASNAMLAARISFMNEVAALCEKMGGDIGFVRQVMGFDPRIGSQFLYAGLGYGGSCFPKDVLALIQLGKETGCPLPSVQATNQTNQRQRELFLQKIFHHFGGSQNLKGKSVAFCGIAFKPETDDIRQAPAITLIEKLLDAGARVHAFDPVAMDNAKLVFGSKVNFCPGNYQCLEGADCLVIATEWNEFRSPNFLKMRQLMKNPVIFDGRNLYPTDKMQDLGFDYYSIGR